MKNEKSNTHIIKIPTTQYNVHAFLKNRWSARSFSETPISQDDLHTLIEAASWSFSSNNEQPWRFIVARRHTPDFDKILDSLMPGNTPWAKNAAAYVVSIAKTTIDKEGNPPNAYAEHDLGAANMCLVLQALTMDIYAHPMAGFDKQKISTAFGLADHLKPLVVIALGHLDDAEKLPEPYKTRELAPRTRKSINEIVLDTEGS